MASFLASLTPELRREAHFLRVIGDAVKLVVTSLQILMTEDESVIAQLPPELAAEAQALRERSLRFTFAMPPSMMNRGRRGGFAGMIMGENGAGSVMPLLGSAGLPRGTYPLPHTEWRETSLC